MMRKIIDVALVYLLIFEIGMALAIMTYLDDSYTDIVKIKPMENLYEVYSLSDIPEEGENVAQIVKTYAGDNKIVFQRVMLVRYKLPSEVHKGIDHSSFQPYMCYSAVKNKKTKAWKILNDQNAYTDENGFRRAKIEDDHLSLGEDDYIIALGNYYKKKHSTGDRYLVITTTGMYTAVVGDEKSDNHTDALNMFTYHGNGKYAGVIEWIVDTVGGKLSKSIRRAGSVTAGDIEELKGKILHIYKIL